MFTWNRIRLGACALAGAAFAQGVLAADSPTAGRTLFNGGTSPACTQCHVDVNNRRQAIDPTGDLDFDAVLAAFLNAIATRPEMAGFNGLSVQQKRDIAAYIADVPKARPNLVDFVASATNTETAVTRITFSNGVTATTSLTLTSIGITGVSASDFLIKPSTTCSNSMTLVSSQQCFIDVTFRTASGTTKTALLNVTFTPQGGTSTTRTAQLNGTVSGQGGGSTANTGGGGGALPLAGLGLLLAAGALRHRSRRPI